MSLAFLGAGNMGSAIISSLLKKDLILPSELRIVDRSAERLQEFAKEGIRVSQNAEDVLPGAHTVFLAVKPQDAGELLAALAGSFEPDTLLISIAAGISVNFLREKSGLQKVVRVMPNLPAVVQLGVSGMYAPREMPAEAIATARRLLESFGVVVNCETEEQIDAITALSASGPAYYFHILEIMAQEAERFGFSPAEGRKIVLGTLRGAGELAESSPDDFSLLREKVTSKGGTTEAALRKFTELGLPETLRQGIQAAFERARELGR